MADVKRSWNEEYFPFLSSQFKFKNPLPAIQKNYQEGGIGQAIGGLVRQGYEGAKEAVTNPTGGSTFIGDIKRGFGVAETAPAAETSAGRTLSPSPAEEAARRRLPGRIGITAITPEGTATYQPGTGVAMPPPATEKERIAGRISPENPYGADVVGGNMRTGQIRVGAATDAEAARNLQARAEQDQAAQAEAARMDRATEALRSLREARSPAVNFGMTSFGGGPDALDVASGRVINRDTPVNVVADSMINAVDVARRFGAGGKAGRLAAKQIGESYLADKELQGLEAKAQASGVDPLDMARYMVDQNKLEHEQNKFGWQQGLDKRRLALEELRARGEMSTQDLAQRKYKDERNQKFLESYSYPDENAPQGQLGALVLQMSDATGGSVPPEVMATYLEQAAKANNVDWNNAPPKDLRALAEKAMALATQANR